MTLVLDKFRTLLPKTKTSPSGWISFNAPCCHHRGHKQDTRKRAGVMFSEGVVYNCFNCKFTASWQPGRSIGEKFKSLCGWLGASQDDIKELVFEALKTEAVEYQPENFIAKSSFEDKPLPEAAMPISEWISSTYLSDISEDIGPVIDYIYNRGFDPLTEHFYWSPAPGYTDRLILPFRWEGRIVGNTARKVTEGKPKYLSDQHPHFVFNVDAQDELNRYIFVVEGPFDALSIGGVALLTNDVADQQARIIDSLGKEVILIPDQDRPGLSLIDRAIHYNWSVAFPTWDNSIKDCADAVQKYGKLFVIVDAIQTAQKGEIRIEMAKRKLENKIKLRNQDV
jgi:hypothetical protein